MFRPAGLLDRSIKAHCHRSTSDRAVTSTSALAACNHERELQSGIRARLENASFGVLQFRLTAVAQPPRMTSIPPTPLVLSLGIVCDHEAWLSKWLDTAFILRLVKALASRDPDVDCRSARSVPGLRSGKMDGVTELFRADVARRCARWKRGQWRIEPRRLPLFTCVRLPCSRRGCRGDVLRLPSSQATGTGPPGPVRQTGAHHWCLATPVPVQGGIPARLLRVLLIIRQLCSTGTGGEHCSPCIGDGIVDLVPAAQFLAEGNDQCDGKWHSFIRTQPVCGNRQLLECFVPEALLPCISSLFHSPPAPDSGER